MEDEDAQQHRAEGADAGPHGVGCAYRQRLGGFGQQHGTEDVEQHEAAHPFPIRQPDEPFGLAETEGEAHFTKSCHYEYYPMHRNVFLIIDKFHFGVGGDGVGAAGGQVAAEPAGTAALDAFK